MLKFNESKARCFWDENRSRMELLIINKFELKLYDKVANYLWDEIYVRINLEINEMQNVNV